MRILFCGLGSIGQKHLRNLDKALSARGIAFTVDALRATDTPLPDDIAAMLSHTYSSAQTLPGGYDIAFVTNPTALHAQTLRDIGGIAQSIYIEKPVFSDPDTDIDALGLGGGVYHVACPLRFHPVVQRIKALAEVERPAAVRAVCSSYLPDWRPGADYRAGYSARRELGGGVALDLIHEWDYLCWIFGMPDEVAGFRGHLSGLDIDSDDVAVYVARTPGTVLSLQLDYIGRPPMRGIELFGDGGNVRGDILANTVALADGSVETLPPRDIHLADVDYFLQCVLDGRAETMNPPRHALAVLRVALAAREVRA